MAGTVMVSAIGGMPWKHSDRHTTMNGQIFSGEDLSGEDLGWQGISPSAPAIEDPCVAGCSTAFIAEAKSGDTPSPTITRIASIRLRRRGMFTVQIRVCGIWAPEGPHDHILPMYSTECRITS